MFAGQSTKACELFLKNRAAAVQTAIRQLRIEGATLLYIHKLCNIFFTSLLETAKEFEMDFAGNTGCYSAFVVWSQSAMGMFVDAFSKQVNRGRCFLLLLFRKVTHRQNRLYKVEYL